MERTLAVGHVDIGRTVVGGGVAFAKVVGLDLGGSAAEPLPVDLVQIIRFQDGTGHDTGTGGRLHHDRDDAEEDVKVTLHGGCVTGLGDGVGGSVGVIV